MPQNKTLAEIDAELEKEFFSEEEDKPEEDKVDETVDEDNPVVEEVEVDVTPDEDEEEDKPDVKPTKEEKQEYAWKEMRQKNKDLQTKLTTQEEFTKRLEGMAKGLGYDSTDELLKRYESEQTEKEAKDKGVDPAFYKEFKDMQSELDNTKKEKMESERQAKIANFTNALDTLVKENGFSDNENKIIEQLDNDGYTLDDIVAVKSPKRLLSGYMVDMLAEKKVQSKLKADKEAFKDEKHDNTPDVTTDDLDKQIEQELKEYARQNGYRY